MRMATVCSDDLVILPFRVTISVSCALLLPSYTHTHTHTHTHTTPHHTHHTVVSLLEASGHCFQSQSQLRTWQKCQTPHNDPHTDVSRDHCEWKSTSERDTIRINDLPEGLWNAL